MSDPRREWPCPAAIRVTLIFFLLFTCSSHSAESLPLVGEEIISPGNKVCIYGKGKNVAAARQPINLVCSEKMDNRPGSDKKTFILVD